MLIVGRPLSGNSSGVVLTRPAASGTAGLVLGGVWLALLAGLIGGMLAGALLARFIARPIRQAAAAAGRLSAGDRSIRLVGSSTAEGAELAGAFNQLAAALQTSEGREREFLLSVSHELRTPLSTIRGYAEALADGVVDADDAPKAGTTMLAEAERLDRLISDLLVLSRLEAADLPLDIVGVDLADLMRTAAEAWAPRCIPDGPRLLVELPSQPVVVDTDPGRIRQVVDGLCENALRIVPQGAPLVLAVRAGPQAGILEIRDGGPGFTDDDLAVAFQRGALHRRYRGIRKVGSGLGLALAARLVARLGGTIEAGHAPEGGARFTVDPSLHNPNTTLIRTVQSGRTIPAMTRTRTALTLTTLGLAGLLGLTACGIGAAGHRPRQLPTSRTKPSRCRRSAWRPAWRRPRHRPRPTMRRRTGGTPSASTCARTPCTAR